MPDSPIRTATAADEERCLAALALAFGGDPPTRWAWPDPQQYLEAFPRFARAFGGGALGHGTADCYRDFAGVAWWLPPGAGPDEASLVELIHDTIVGSRKDAMLALLGQMDAYHPKEAHWYLPLIGVDPAHQGKGIGSALMQRVLAECDGQRIPAYLEATSARSIPFYERHGFAALGRIQVADSPPIVPMSRKPR